MQIWSKGVTMLGMLKKEKKSSKARLSAAELMYKTRKELLLIGDVNQD